MIFSESVQIHLQGDPALHFLKIQSIGPDQPFAKFQLIGFHNPEIVLQDYRSTTIAAIRSIQQTGQSQGFAAIFNSPAQATFYSPTPAGPATLLLHPTDQNYPSLALWLSSNVGAEIPVYDYHYRHICKVDTGQYAFLALFTRNLETEVTPYLAEIDSQIQIAG